MGIQLIFDRDQAVNRGCTVSSHTETFTDDWDCQHVHTFHSIRLPHATWSSMDYGAGHGDSNAVIDANRWGDARRDWVLFLTANEIPYKEV